MRKAFLSRVRQAIADPSLQGALDRNADKQQDAQRLAMGLLPDPADLRQQARAIRQLTLDRLDAHLGTFTRRLREKGVIVHNASDSEDACRLVVEIARGHEAKTVAKSKSMVTEEIQLNAALAEAGIRAIETDLGEFIVQLRGEAPSHIVAPAIHLTRESIGATFAQELGMPLSTEIRELTGAARSQLREVFLQADIGIAGVNFGVAQTGTICLITNEGNGRMVATLPRVHIAVMGIERLVPTLDDLQVMLQILARSSTGQKLTSYVSLMNGPRRDSDPDGPEERHLILVDNGRSRLRRSALSESLLCIRCGACLNACPVFREIGGHAYASTYSGPIGSVISPGLFGLGKFGHLAEASTLCGACVEACPVAIDLPRLLLRVRAAHIQQADRPRWLGRGLRLYASLAKSSNRFRRAQKLAALVSRVLPARSGWVAALPGPLSAWTDHRYFPPFALRPFRDRIKDLKLSGEPRGPEIEATVETAPLPEHRPHEDKVTRFGLEFEEVGGEFIRCSQSDAADRIVGQLHLLGVSRIMAWGQVEPTLYTVLQRLEEDGFNVVQPHLPMAADRRATMLGELDGVQAGLTGSIAGLAETGTLVLSTGRRRSLLPSLLPPIHLAILRARAIHETMEDWMAAGGSQIIASAQNLTLITGPSRTADIELTLSIGVHGPGQVVVFCIE